MKPAMFKLVAVLLPLGLDTFAVAAALGMAGLPHRQRFRVGMLFTCFEMGMPIVGLLIGAVAASLIGQLADAVAILVLAGLGRGQRA